MRAAAIVKRAAVPTIGAAALAELTLSAAVSAKAGGGATRAVIRTAGRAGAIAPDPTHAGFSLARAQNYRAESGVVSITVADFDGDARPDVVTADEGAAAISTFLNKGGGRLATHRLDATAHRAWAIVSGDLNGDGKADVATANGLDSSMLSVLLNRGDGSFGPPRDYATEADPEALTIGDLDGDGRPDVVVANLNAHTVSVFLNVRDGSLGARRDYAADHPQSVAIGDLNGDGEPDLAVANCSIAAPVTVLLNDGHGPSARDAT